MELVEGFGWQTFPTKQADHIFSLWIGKAAKRAGQRNYNIAYYSNRPISRSLDLDTVLKKSLEVIPNVILSTITEHTYFAALVHQHQSGHLAVLNALTAPHPDVPAILEEARILKIDGYGLLMSETLEPHIFPCPKLDQARIRAFLCLDWQSPTDFEEISKGELTIELLQRSNKSRRGTGKALLDATRLAECAGPSYRINPARLREALLHLGLS